VNAAPLQARLSGTPRTRYLLELFGNSAQFPIANILLEMLLEGPGKYLLAADLYTILVAGLAQAWFLSRWETGPRPRRFLGNLIGPALYTLIETSLEGVKFFEAPHHLAYWCFACVIGALQAIRWRSGSGTLQAAALVLENVVRAGILLAMYVLFELITNSKYTSVVLFFADSSHRFVALANLLLGLSLGLSSLTGQRHLDLLKHTSAQLNTYSEWLLGRDLLARLIADPHALTLTRRERAVLFADIRGFTRWCEPRAPEEIVALIDRYYDCAETILNRHRVIKFKFSADEVMAVFPDADNAAAAARELRDGFAALLESHGLGTGIGIHAGPLVEGLLGSGGVKFYDVIGDTVNTAKRIESAAGAGEILISEAAVGTLAHGERREIQVKGKEAPLAVFVLN
jgi:class 3 adenylate cyclase